MRRRFELRVPKDRYARERRRKPWVITRKNTPVIDRAGNFDCPACSGLHSLSVLLKSHEAVLRCSLCGLEDSLPKTRQGEAVDYLSKFTDKIYEARKTNARAYIREPKKRNTKFAWRARRRHRRLRALNAAHQVPSDGVLEFIRGTR